MLTKLECLKGKAGIQTKDGYRVIQKGGVFEVDDAAMSSEEVLVGGQPVIEKGQIKHYTLAEHLIKQKIAKKVGGAENTAPVAPAPQPTYTQAQVDAMIAERVAEAVAREKAAAPVAFAETPALAENAQEGTGGDTGAGPAEAEREAPPEIPKPKNKPRR